MAQHGIFTVKLRSFGSVPVSVPITQVLPDKCPNTVREITVINLLRRVIQLMPVSTKTTSVSTGQPRKIS
jgi:hypothetical protein